MDNIKFKYMYLREKPIKEFTLNDFIFYFTASENDQKAILGTRKYKNMEKQYLKTLADYESFIDNLKNNIVECRQYHDLYIQDILNRF